MDRRLQASLCTREALFGHHPRLHPCGVGAPNQSIISKGTTALSKGDGQHGLTCSVD